MQEKPISGCCTAPAGQREHGPGLYGYPPAMVYAPVQAFRGLYDPRTALCRGTLFNELDLPFEGGGPKAHCGCGPRGNGRRG